MDRDTKIILESIQEDIHELKDLNKAVVKLMQATVLLKEEMKSSNAKHDEGRKVLHKRLDIYGSVGLWAGASIVTAMGGVIMVLVNKILG